MGKRNSLGRFFPGMVFTMREKKFFSGAVFFLSEKTFYTERFFLWGIIGPGYLISSKGKFYIYLVHFSGRKI